MTAKLPGKDISLWVETTKRTNYPTLESDNTNYNTVVVGGGITGIAMAYRLQKRGRRVALIEKSRLAEWTTGGTTAKLSSQHYLIYNYLIKHRGEMTARAFAHANEKGIYEIGKLSKKLDIKCDLASADSYVYSHDPDKTNEIKAEVAAAKCLGLPASFEMKTELPFPVTSAIKFSDQAEFHPRKFLLGLAKKFVENGGVIYENTEATDIKPGQPNVVVTNRGELKAKYVVQASGEPFWRNEIFKGRMWVKMSYALAVKLKNSRDYPKNMYITTDHPMRTIRTARYKNGKVLIFGGESHEYDDAKYNPDVHYQHLVKDVKKRFDVDQVLFRWLAGDFMPYDRIPFIGPDPKHPTVFVATGYRAWGLAWAMSAAYGIASYIKGNPADWVKPFSLDRLSVPLKRSERTHGL